MRQRAIWIAISLLVPACHTRQPREQQQPASPAASVLNVSPTATFFPGDGISGRGQQIPVLTIDQLLDANLVASVKPLVSLMTWPELTPVAAAAAVSQKEGLTSFELQPGGALADRWYVLAVSAPTLPGPVAWARDVDSYSLPNGTRGVRFRPGSDPKLNAVEFCKKGGSYSVRLLASELLMAAKPVDSIVSLEVGTTAATLKSLGISAEVAFATSDLTETSEVRLSIGSGLQTPAGLPLTDHAGKTTFDIKAKLDALPSHRGVCRRLVL